MSNGNLQIACSYQQNYFIEKYDLNFKNNQKSFQEDNEAQQTQKNSFEEPSSSEINQVEEEGIGDENEESSSLSFQKQQKCNAQQKGTMTPISAKLNNNLYNIPEAEAEETPVRNTYKYLNNTCSNSNNFEEKSNESNSPQKKVYQLNQKDDNSILRNNKNYFGTSARQLFTKESNNRGSSTSVSANSTPTSSKRKHSSREVISRVDSNLRDKKYHSQIIRKNKSRGSGSLLSQQQTNQLMNSSNFGDSNDMSVSAILNISSISNAKLNNNSSYEESDFPNLLIPSEQNLKLKLQYYEYLLEDTQIQQERFIKGIAGIIDKEVGVYKKNTDHSKLLSNIDFQRSKIQQQQEQISALKQKAAQLSQLLIMYKQEIVSMNNESFSTLHLVKGMQDELSTIILMFQFSEPFEFQNYEGEDGECISSLIQKQLEQLKGIIEQFIQNKNITTSSVQIYKPFQFKEKVTQLLKIIAASKEGKQLSQQEKSIMIPNFSKHQGDAIDQRLEEELVNQLEIEIMEIHKQKLKKDKDFEKITLENLLLKKQLKESEFLQTLAIKQGEEEKNQFKSTIQNLKRQLAKCKEQQFKLDGDIFQVHIKKKQALYDELVNKLKCQFSMCNEKEQQNESFSLESRKNISQIKNQESQQSNTTNNKNNQNTTHFEKKNSDTKIVIINAEIKNNSSGQEQSQCQIRIEGNKSEELKQLIALKDKKINKLEEELKLHHTSQIEYQKRIVDFLVILDCIESSTYVNRSGNLITSNTDLIQNILSPDLKSWIATFFKNFHIAIQQIIKRQVEKIVHLSSSKKLQLKKLIYSSDYEGYFKLLFNNFNEPGVR